MVDVLNVSTADTTPGNNASLSGTSILGSGLLSTADDSFRTLTSFLAKWWNDIGGVNTVAGSGDAITITTPTLYASLKTGMRLQFIAGAANTTAVTINLDAIGAKAGRKISGGTDVAMAAGDLAIGVRYDIVYSAAANSAAGGWIFFNSSLSLAGYLLLAGGTMTGQLINTGSTVGYTPVSLISTEAAAAAGPLMDLYRNSASPAAADLIGEIDFNGQNSTPAKKTYAAVRVRIDDATAASEDATLQLATQKAGTLTDLVYLGANAAGTATPDAIGLPRGNLSFPATDNPSADVNTLDDYEEGTWTPAFSASGATFNYTSQVGTYTKIGNRVFFTCRINLNTSGNTLTANALSLGGLPFTSNASPTTMGFPIDFSGCTTSYVSLMVNLAGGATSFTFDGLTAAATSYSGSQLCNAICSAAGNTVLRFSGHYTI